MRTKRPGRARLAPIVGVLLAAAAAQGASADTFAVATIQEFEGIFERPSSPAISAAYRGAIVMRWDRKRFREFSGLHSDGGARLIAVSDRGALLQLALVHRDGRLVGALNPVLDRLRGPDGALLKRKEGDAESLTSDGQGGLVVAFERRPRLLRYLPPYSGVPEEIALPGAIARFPENRGIEALARLCDGRFLVVAQAESAFAPNAWIGDAGGWTERHFTRTEGYSPTGATTLPDCSVAVLERREASGDRHSARIRILPNAALRDGSGRLHAVKLFGPLTSREYKFEGITSAGQGPGRVMLYLISDSGADTGTALVAFQAPAIAINRP